MDSRGRCLCSSIKARNSHEVLTSDLLPWIVSTTRAATWSALCLGKNLAIKGIQSLSVALLAM